MHYVTVASAYSDYLVPWETRPPLMFSISRASLLFQFPKGFISHFYGVSEHISPLLVWGFLGPDDSLNDLCNFFKVSHTADSHALSVVEVSNILQLVLWSTLDPTSLNINILDQNILTPISQILLRFTSNYNLLKFHQPFHNTRIDRTQFQRSCFSQ